MELARVGKVEGIKRCSVKHASIVGRWWLPTVTKVCFPQWRCSVGEYSVETALCRGTLNLAFLLIWYIIIRGVFGVNRVLLGNFQMMTYDF